jgi:6-pyruvoyltetrahydropterin/6-carboxytetrahydropterin synthase
MRRGLAMTIEMFREFTFEAAHRTTPDTPLHGHSFKVKLVLTGEPVPGVGWTHDLFEIDPIIERVRHQVDHTYLNESIGVELPSLENIARWLFDQFDSAIKGVVRVELRRGLEGASEGCSISARSTAVRA